MEQVKRLTILVGPPGSGKSTVAKEGYGTDTYVNQDSQGKVGHWDVFEAALLKGENIIVDRMNFSKQQRGRYLEPAKKAGYRTEIYVIHQPYKTCFERAIARENHETIKDEVAARQALALFFGKYERPTQDEADELHFVYPQLDDYKPRVVICDLDGTLCNVDHRLHFVRKPEGVRKDWKGFFENISGDSVNKWCETIIKGLPYHIPVVFCSGRPDNYRKQTQQWLDEHGFDSIPLFMRPRNDSRDDSIVKEIILDFEILTRYTPYFMIDDRKRVFEMWRKRGFTCLACAEGEF